MTNLDTEQALEDRTMRLFASLGWATANAFYEAFDPHKATASRPYLGRADDSQVLLLPRLRAGLEKLNHLPPAALEAAIAELARGRSVVTPVQANHEVHQLLKEGVPVTYRDDQGRGCQERVRVIDWNDPANNDFMMVQQLWISGEASCRPDLVGFVNGIPLLFGELKAHHKRLINAYQDNLARYKVDIPHLFWYTGFILLSNGSRSLIGNLSASFKHFGAWKKVLDEKERGVISLETLVRAACAPARLLDLVENFTLYHEGNAGLEKITAKNHQYLGVENVIAAVRRIRHNRGKLGVFWHTQGSGKSFSMIFFSRKTLRKLGGNWTFVIVTDRKDLDEQIYKNFARCGVVTDQKFHTEKGQEYPVISEREDIILITDEAHRTQYATLAMNMRSALPNAAFIGFTGTPLMAAEVELTRQVFGDYVSVYNFRQSVEDQATVPLFYENRIPELELTSQELDSGMDALLEQADVDRDDDQIEAELARQFVREYHIITRDDRLEKIAADIVDHFIQRGHRGKAMVVSIDKLTTVKMYDKVQDHWQRKLDALRAELGAASPVERPHLQDLVDYMESTDMAVVVSHAQHEDAKFKKHGLAIAPHRQRRAKEDLAEKFKKADDPLRIAFVCAMWRTGFDAPACSTIYLDRPMRNHTLMQTIARANRVFGDKVNGLIVDYIGIFHELQKALAIYAAGRGAEEVGYPIKDKSALVQELQDALDQAQEFCRERGVELAPILQSSDAFEHIALVDAVTHQLVDAQTEESIDDSIERIIVNDGLKTQFLNLVANVDRLFHAILPDTRAAEFGPRRKLLVYLANKIRNLARGEVETPDVEAQVTGLLDDSIKARGYVIREPSATYDLSEIDFDALEQQFARGRRRTEAERLRGVINARLQLLIRRNRSRVSYQQEFQRLIDAYNAGSLNIETFFGQLLALAQRLNEEEQRHMRENLTEEELAIFDILTRPDMHLTAKQERQVKKIARDLLTTLGAEKLILDWHKRQQSRAAVRLAIKDILYDHLPDPYTPELCNQKRDDVYQHIYANYYGAGQSIYAAA